MKPTALRAIQPRSQKTRDRLLDAAEASIRSGGPEAATVPAIARRAGVAVGSVYRRFRDKDSLLRSVYERFFDSLAQPRAGLPIDRWHDDPLERVVPELVAQVVQAYRADVALMQGLLRYADRHPDQAFRQRAEALRCDATQHVRQLLLERRKEIGHPDPEAAIAFLLVTIGVVLKGRLLDPEPPDHEGWEHVNGELQTLAIRYLGIAW